MSLSTGNETGGCKNILRICSKRILPLSGQAKIDDYKRTSRFAEEGTANSRWHPASHGGFCWDGSSLINVFCRMLTFHHLDFLHRIMTFSVVIVAVSVVVGLFAIHTYVSLMYHECYFSL